MANEPEREIEKLLKAAAKQRQNEAGESRELHPATRRMLLAEAARVHGRSARSGVGAIFWGSWFRVVMSAGAVVIVLLTAWILLPGSAKQKQSFQLAKNETEFKKETSALRQRESERLPVAAAPPPPQAVDQLQDNSKRITGNASQAAPAPATPAAEPNALAETPYAANRSLKVQTAPAVVPPAAPAPQTGESLTLANSARDDKSLAFDARQSQNLYRRELSSLGGKQLDRENNPVLNSFRFEETGNQVRIVDSDGSVYTGFLQTPAEAAKKPASLAVAKALPSEGRRKDTQLSGGALPSSNVAMADVDSASVVAPQNMVFFRVTGTNVSLHQEVDFTGRLLVESGTNAAATNAIRERAAVAGEIAQPPARNSRVEGRAVIGRTNQVEIKARVY